MLDTEKCSNAMHRAYKHTGVKLLPVTTKGTGADWVVIIVHTHLFMNKWHAIGL